jgi:hypothetical protein
MWFSGGLRLESRSRKRLSWPMFAAIFYINSRLTAEDSASFHNILNPLCEDTFCYNVSLIMDIHLLNDDLPTTDVV